MVWRPRQVLRRSVTSTGCMHHRATPFPDRLIQQRSGCRKRLTKKVVGVTESGISFDTSSTWTEQAYSVSFRTAGKSEKDVAPTACGRLLTSRPLPVNTACARHYVHWRCLPRNLWLVRLAAKGDCHIPVSVSVWAWRKHWCTPPPTRDGHQYLTGGRGGRGHRGTALVTWQLYPSGSQSSSPTGSCTVRSRFHYLRDIAGTIKSTALVQLQRPVSGTLVSQRSGAVWKWRWPPWAPVPNKPMVSGRTSVRHRFGSPFSSKRLWFVDTVLWLCPSLPTETLKWLSSLPILMQKSFRWWQCSDRYILSLSPHLHTPFPTFSPSLISRTVSVDVKHHVYLLTKHQNPNQIYKICINCYCCQE